MRVQYSIPGNPTEPPVTHLVAPQRPQLPILIRLHLQPSPLPHTRVGDSRGYPPATATLLRSRRGEILATSSPLLPRSPPCRHRHTRPKREVEGAFTCLCCHCCLTIVAAWTLRHLSAQSRAPALLPLNQVNMPLLMDYADMRTKDLYGCSPVLRVGR